MSVQDVTSETFDVEVLSATSPVIVDFWGPRCQHCLTLLPAVEALAQAYQGRLKVVKANASQSPRLCMRLRVMGLPTFLLFRDGEEVGRLTGEVTPEQLKALAAEAVA